MNRRMDVGPSCASLIGALFGVMVAFLLAISPALAVYSITEDDIWATTGNETQSGNGLLDYIFFIDASGGGVSENSFGTFDGDDANQDMPKGGTETASESFVTSIGELRDFYILNFPDGQGGSLIAQIALFLDMNQTGNDPSLTLDDLVIVVDYLNGLGNPYGDDRDDPATYDVSSDLQNSTGTDFSGGTIVAQLDSPKVLPLNQQGAGWADYIIGTGIDPFDPAFSDSTRILFYWESSDHNDGGETVFLSGSYGIVPEPTSMAIAGLGVLLVLVRRRRG